MAVSNLSAWQSFLSQMFPGKNARISPEQFEQAANQFFGPIPIPPGSQIISQSAGSAEYIDPEGYRHVLRRSLDGRDPNAGQVQDSTARPAVLPGGQQSILRGLTGGFQGLSEQQINNALALARGETPRAFQIPEGLAALDPDTAAALEAMSQAEQAQIQQQQQDASDQLLARLYGSGVQRSSIANEGVARLAQMFGLIRQQQLADAASRNLQTRQFLTGERRTNRALTAEISQAQTNPLLALLEGLAGQQTQRDISSANVGLGYDELAERARQANLNFELGQQQSDLQAAEQGSLFNKILRGISAAGQVAGGAGTLLGAIRQPKMRTT